MRGSGHYPGGERQSLGNKFRNEIESALQLLFKNVAQHEVSVSLQTNLTAYLTEIPCESIFVPLQPPDFAVSSDPLASLRSQEREAYTLPLLPAEAALAENSPCEMEPVLCYEPVFEAMEIALQGVTFENVDTTQCQEWVIETAETDAQCWEVEALDLPESRPVNLPRFRIASRGLMDDLPPIKSSEDSRFYALPIKKSPIPPHRFSAAAKDVFRKALAEKAKTYPNNVQLRVVYERMDMMLFAGIQQDEQGNLLCTPKNELIGRNQNRNKPKSDSAGGTYLVYGFRLDTKEDLRALVPSSALTQQTPAPAPKKKS